MRAIDIYLNHFDGNQSQAGKALGKKQQHIWFWLNNPKGTDMPIELVIKAAKIMNVHPKVLRPDIFDLDTV